MVTNSIIFDRFKKILDQFKKPHKKQSLRHRQTERADTVSLYTSFGHHPSRGLTPDRLASILLDAEGGNLIEQCALFEDIEEKDAHIFAEMGKRKRAMLPIPFTIKPPLNPSREEIKATEFVQEAMQGIPNMEDIILDMADAIGKGYSCLEMTWDVIDNFWIPDVIDWQEPAIFTIDDKDKDKLLLNTNNGKQELQPFSWIVHKHKSKSGALARSGLHRVLAWLFLFKNYAIRDLAEFLEIYGLPLRLGSYPAGATEDEKLTLLQAVVEIGHNAAGIIPQGMSIDFKEAAKGNSSPYQYMTEWCERCQSKAILGGTLTSQADGKTSTNALGNVHNECRKDLTLSDLKQIAGTLNQDLIYPLVVLNMPGITSLRRCPRLSFDTRNPDDINELSQALPNLIDAGVRIPLHWANEKLHIPVPEENDAILQRPPNQTASLSQQNNNISALNAINQNNHQDVADHYSQQVAEQDSMTTMINVVKAHLNTVNSLEEFRDTLLELFPKLDEQQFSEVMQFALTAGHLSGRYEVNEEN